MSLNIFGPITVPLLICMLECLRCQKSCQGSLIFSFATQKSAFGRNHGSLCGLSHVSTLPGLTLLLAINHLTIIASCGWFSCVWQNLNSGLWVPNSVLLLVSQ